MKRQLPNIMPESSNSTSRLIKPRSFETPKQPHSTLSRSVTADGRVSSTPLKIPPPRQVHPPAQPQLSSTESLYQIVTPEALSVSPLRPSASMLLLNRAAQVISNSKDAVKRMPVETATLVYQLPKKSPVTEPSNLKREESLLAVFKPATDDGDSLTVHSGTKVALRISPDDRAMRERAAYLLDKAYRGFSKVPATALANIQNSNGSLQEFVASDGTAEDHPDLVGRASCLEVQKVAVLDCRIFNMDRHGGNILVKKISNGEMAKPIEEESSFFMFGGDDDFPLQQSFTGDVVLTPIDHSISLPPWNELGEAWFDWGYYPQANEVLVDEVKAHILSLDWRVDARCLRDLGIKGKCVATNSVATISLQAFVRENPRVTLSMLCDFFQRPYPSEHRLHHIESPLEQIISEVCMQQSQDRDKEPSEEFLTCLEKELREQIRTDTWKSFMV